MSNRADPRGSSHDDKVASAGPQGLLRGRRLLVTGGNGFLGNHGCKALANYGPQEIFVPRSSRYDLRERGAVHRLFRDARPDVVFHLAAVVGGIKANRASPGCQLSLRPESPTNAILGARPQQMFVVTLSLRFGVPSLIILLSSPLIIRLW